MENKFDFSEEQIKKINKTALAEKHQVSSQYVGQVLSGKKVKSKTSKKIKEDAQRILNILGDPIMKIEVINPEIVTA
ncbi:MAG: hypothetical protein JJE55_07085 [Flavobacteriaceae bacterium]|nr:hypothetical protein [Flavobacteriaceae bacterium]